MANREAALPQRLGAGWSLHSSRRVHQRPHPPVPELRQWLWAPPAGEQLQVHSVVINSYNNRTRICYCTIFLFLHRPLSVSMRRCSVPLQSKSRQCVWLGKADVVRCGWHAGGGRRWRWKCFALVKRPAGSERPKSTRPCLWDMKISCVGIKDNYLPIYYSAYSKSVCLQSMKKYLRKAL